MKGDFNLLKEGYRLLLEPLTDYAVSMLDTDGIIISWNRGAEKIFRAVSEEVIGKHFSITYIPSDIDDDMPRRDLQTAHQLGMMEMEGWRVRHDGTKFWAAIALTALKDERDKVVGYGSVTRDLTTGTASQEKLFRINTEMQTSLMKSRSEVLDYKHALDESSIVAITDQKGMIKYVNDYFCRISKYSREELLGQDHRILNSELHSKEFIRDLWVTIANGKIWRGELRNKAKDGTYYWVDTTIVPFLNEKGKPYQYLAIRSDITSRKAAEDQLHRLNEVLENKVRDRTLELTQALEREKQLSDMKSQFVSTASHEFRTPLSAILSSISLIEHYADPALAEKRNRHIERIKSSVKNLTSILDDFLSLEKLEGGSVQTSCLDFDLQEFVKDVIEEIEGMARKKNQKILLEYSGERNVCQDRKILRNILLNLLTNAIKYSGEEKSVEVIVDAKQEMTKIMVVDHGIGIPLDAQSSLFSRFFRARNAMNIQGIGLGLHIVKRYVELIGGTIEFSTVENQGTTFSVCFPSSVPDLLTISQVPVSKPSQVNGEGSSEC